MRPDDRRSAKGYRVLFDRETERDCWHIARQLKMLSPDERHRVRLFVESVQRVSAVTAMAAAGSEMAQFELDELDRGGDPGYLRKFLERT